MKLHADFCPLISSVQGYLLQFLDEEKTKFRPDFAESQLGEFTSFLRAHLPGASAPSICSLHHMLLLSTRVAPVADSEDVQSTLAILRGAQLPPAAYLHALQLPEMSNQLLNLLMDPTEAAAAAELCSALAAACCDSREVAWSVVPVLMRGCLAVWGAGDGRSAGSAEASAGRLLDFVRAAVEPDPPAGRPALALAQSLLPLLEDTDAGDLTSPHQVVGDVTGPHQVVDDVTVVDAAADERRSMSELAAGALESTLALFRRVTLSVWLDWAEEGPEPSAADGDSLQAAVSASLLDLVHWQEERRLCQPPGALDTEELVSVLAPFAREELLSVEERAAAAMQSGSERTRRRHLHRLVAALDMLSEPAVLCLEQCRHLLTIADLQRLVELAQVSADRPGQLRDRLVELVVGELVSRPSSAALQDLKERVLTAGVGLVRSDWDQLLRTTTAQMVAGDDSAQSLATLLLQSPRPLLQQLVLQTAESAGKAALLTAALPRLQQLLPLQLLRDGSAGLLESLILAAVSPEAGVQQVQQLGGLLAAAVACGAVRMDAALAEKVAALPATDAAAQGGVLRLIQAVVGAAAGGPADWCCPLALCCGVVLDRTLDLENAWGADAAATLELRSLALGCLRAMRDLGCGDPDGRLSRLADRVHPVTELYLRRWLLSSPAPEDLSLLHGLADPDAPAWQSGQHTLLKATLASYLPYFCDEEWRLLHPRLLDYHSGQAPLAPERPRPAEHRPLARALWYYCDLVTLWTTEMDGQPESESLTLPADRLLHCLQMLSANAKRSLEPLSEGGDSYAEDLAAAFLPLTHVLGLVSDPPLRQPLEMLCTFITAQFVQQVSSRSGPTAPPPAEPHRPEWQMDQMDSAAGVISQFVVGCFNIPNDSPIKKRLLQSVSGAVVTDLAPAG